MLETILEDYFIKNLLNKKPVILLKNEFFQMHFAKLCSTVPEQQFLEHLSMTTFNILGRFKINVKQCKASKKM